METVALKSYKSTTRLGFGGSSIMGALGRKESLTLLEHAFDAGIRHFDTAPLYGYGQAEACLGEFLKRHRNSVTITTKFGIPPGQKNKVLLAGRSILSPVLKAVPGLKTLLKGAKPSQRQQPIRQTDAVRQANPIFNVDAARTSLEASLSALGTDHIDLWLLHEVRAIDLASDPNQDALLRFMENAVLAGKIGLFGVGSDRAAIPALLRSHPRYCQAVQQEWSVLNPVSEDSASVHIYHRALSEHFGTLASALAQDAVLAKRWSEEVGQDLSKPGALARFMLKASYLLNAGSIILFSSKKASHIADNVATVGDLTLDSAAQKLYLLLQREWPTVPPPAR